jgi:diphosphomevalonate decarboxylase
MEGADVIAPSNIALVKYWGKREGQIPWNPSVSLTLSSSHTRTQVLWEPGAFEIDFEFEGRPKPEFVPKIEQFFRRALEHIPGLFDYRFVIRSSNSFPHSSGIASSASAFAALGCALAQFKAGAADWDRQMASELARLGSGSAARSIEGPLMVWGKSNLVDASSDFRAVVLDKVHPLFKTYKDRILIVETGRKKVSSTHGHALMNGHAFGPARIEMAHKRLGEVLAALETGDLSRFGECVEAEALTLHALMMSSEPSFILMRPNTLALIEKVTELRASTRWPVCFTLDAGANLHLLFPQEFEQKIDDFVQSECVDLCQDGLTLDDSVGTGCELTRKKGASPS